MEGEEAGAGARLFIKLEGKNKPFTHTAACHMLRYSRQQPDSATLPAVGVAEPGHDQGVP